MSEVEPALGPALPGEPCRVPPHAGWSELERWVWQEIGSGRFADLNAKLGKAADPKQLGDWQPERCISPAFLETILLHDPWRSAIPRQGVRLEGVWFDGPIELSHARIPCMLWLLRSRLEAECVLVGSEFSASFSLRETFVRGDLCMDAARIRGHLFLRNSTFNDVDLKNSYIDGQVSLQQSNVSHLLRLHGTHVRGSVILRAYETTEGLLPGMGQANFYHLDFIGAKIERDLNLQGAHISGEIRMHHVAVGGDVFFRDTRFEHEIEISYATIGGSLDFRGAHVKAVDLTGSRIGSEL
jgi:hypothetical protein